MDKKVYNAVNDNSQGYCYVCHRYGGEMLELHHILRRKVAATKENCVMLCRECHRGRAGVHGMDGHKLDIELKVKLQNTYFEMGLHEGDVRKLMNGRLYSSENV